MTTQCVESRRHSAEFPVEAVREILQIALDDEDTDQLALFWAAYLFGFDRSRVTGAAGVGDEVHLDFGSESTGNGLSKSFAG